ncbi:MAG: glycosyltransferase [Clostridia bacterium]|nr:glycosyltransferase [Clostridia bacterium]
MKLSVIIPVYKAEITLRRCLDSLLNQPHNDTEIIVINDGSPDSSGEICKEYAEKYDEIRYIEKENGGVSTARNAGLDIARGEYVVFVDSDDWVYDNFFSVIEKALEKNDWDLLQFSQNYTDGKEAKPRILPDFESCEHNVIFEHIIEHMCRKHINKPIDKVYKRSLIEKNHLRFHPELNVGEDRTFNIVFALDIKKWCIVSDLIYYVSLENGESLSRQKRNDLDDQIRIAEEYLFEIIENSELTQAEKALLVQAIQFDNMRAVYTKAKYLHRNGTGYFKRLKELNDYCKQVNKNKFTYPPGKFCTLISLPVKFRLTPVLDAMAWVLTR